MKPTIFLFCFLGLCVCRPPDLPGQESLLTRTFKNSPKIVYSVAFSPDGKYLAASGSGNVLKILRMEDGERVRTISGHEGFINSVAFSRDGKKLVSAGEDGTVRIWNAGTGAPLGIFRGHKDFVSSAAFFPDGTRVASVGADGLLRLWRLGSKNPYKTIVAHSGYGYSVAVSSDGKYVASAGVDKVVKIWDADSGERKALLEGHSEPVNSVAFSPKGQYLASGSDDGTTKVWRVKDFLCVKTFSSGRRPVLAVAYAPDGSHIFSGGAANTINSWDFNGYRGTMEYKGHGGLVRSVAVSPDNKYLASGSFDKTIKIWLTPWEAEERAGLAEGEEAKEREKDARYDKHYQDGLAALEPPTLENLERACQEFSKAYSYRQKEECQLALSRATSLLEQKRAEELAARSRKEKLMRERWMLAGKGLASALVLLTGLRTVRKMRRRASFRKGFVGEVKAAAVLGDYAPLFERYMEFRGMGGTPGSLPPEDLLRLYHGVGLIDKLPREDLPYSFLLSYALKFSGSGNHRTTVQMLRSGELLDEFRRPGDYDTFAEIYGKTERPEVLLLRKFKVSTYTPLAEAFLRVKNYGACKKVCEYKKQFYPGSISRRDKKLADLSQEGLAAAPPQPSA